MMKTVSILGSTGSVGRNTLEVLRQHRNKFRVKLLVANTNFRLLAAQAIEFGVSDVLLLDDTYHEELRQELIGTNTAVHYGMSTLLQLLAEQQDVVISSLIGIDGLEPTYAAIGRCKIMALANKEALVCAGSLILRHPLANKTQIIPLDSEHNAIHQALLGQQRNMLHSITITASGGPFLYHSLEELGNVNISDALRHPNWRMGKKITIDSATMFNKGLEFIEAMYLFSLEPQQIEILVHPQSIIHSMVTYKDGSTLAQMSRPNMQVPIAYALDFPQRIPIKHQPLDLASLGSLTFQTPDMRRFPLLQLAVQAAASGQAAQIIASCANEVAVDAFLNERIKFLDIYKVVDQVLYVVPSSPVNTLEDVMALKIASQNSAVHVIQRLN